MTILRGFLITITSGVVFAIIGGLLGYGLGVMLPDYYRTVFQIPPGIAYQPTHIGLGLGITQGLAAGLVIGQVIVVTVVTVAWSQSRATDRLHHEIQKPLSGI